MAEPITMQKLTDASIDADTLGEFANEDKTVVSRLGAEYPSAPMASRLLVENGLLGATPFSTYAAMTASALVDGDYAVVTQDEKSSANGVYQKIDGEWVYSKYNELSDDKIDRKQTGALALSSGQNSATVSDNEQEIVWGVVDQESKIALGINKSGNIATGNSTIENGDDLFAVADKNGSIAIYVDDTGKVRMPNNEIDGVLTEINGDIYHVNGNTSKKLTTTGDAFAPSALSGIAAKFLSTRLGRLAEYKVNIDGSNESLLYADNREYEQIIVTGQSLAAGVASAETLTAPYPQYALRFTNGPIGSKSEQILPTLTALKEEGSETISTGFAKKLLSTSLDRHLLMSGQAYGGAEYAKIKKGGDFGIYEACIQQVKFGNWVEGKANVRAVFVIHGETDGQRGNTNYASDLREWLDDFNTDIKTANGQSDNVVMLLCQTSSASGYRDAANRDDFTTPLQQLDASNNNNDIYLVCPKYQFDYIDHAHLTAISARTLGEYYAKVYRQVVIKGNDWRPVQPTKFTKSGKKIVIDYHVPVPPLVFDTSILEGADNLHKGFVLKTASAVDITNVQITGDKQVTITLSGDVPADAVLSYAFNNGTYRSSGREQGARGNIRDSDNESSAYNSSIKLHNFCVSFKHNIGD